MHETVIQKLQETGTRLTPVRNSLVEILTHSPSPLSVEELRSRLSKFRLSPNKTTVYRELQFLMNQNIIAEIDLGEGKKRYESKNQPHHHHAVCVNCHKIKDVTIRSEIAVTKKVRTKDFEIQGHVLEFFGLCSNCNSSP